MNEENKTYARDYSHTHCWEQKNSPACGIPLEKHSQCCLCDVVPPMQETKQKEEYCGWCDQNGHLGFCPDNPKQKEIRKRISQILVKWSMPTRQIAIDEIIKEFSTLLSEDRAKIKEEIATKIETCNTISEVDLIQDIINLLNNRE